MYVCIIEVAQDVSEDEDGEEEGGEGGGGGQTSPIYNSFRSDCCIYPQSLTLTTPTPHPLQRCHWMPDVALDALLIASTLATEQSWAHSHVDPGNGTWRRYLSSSVPKGFGQYSQQFNEGEVDGESMFLLKEHHLVELFGLKLGPALKLLDTISRLRHPPA